MTITKKAIAFFLTVVLAAGLLLVYPLAADDAVPIGDFEARRNIGISTRYTISKNDLGQTVIFHDGRASWNRYALAIVNGYTAAKVTEYPRLCFTATFSGINQLYIELPYNGFDNDDHVDLPDCNFIGTEVPLALRNVVTRNDDGSYTFDFQMSSYGDIRRNGLSGISFLLDPDAGSTRNRTMTIIDIGFRKAGEKAGPQHGISLDQTSYVFPEAVVGYSAQTARTVTITNTKTAATGILDVRLSGANAGSYTLSKTSVNGISPIGTPAVGTNSFTIVPKPGLPAGTHSATVTVSNTNVPAVRLDVCFTVAPGEYRIDVSAGTGGNVSGGDTYVGNDTVILTATPAPGYVFDGWYENNIKIPGAGATYEFCAAAARTLEARFELGRYDIIVSAGTGGTADVGRIYNGNERVILTATPNDGYSFDGWYDDNGNKVSGDNPIRFDAIEDRTLEARFKQKDSGVVGGGGFVGGKDEEEKEEEDEEPVAPPETAPDQALPEQHSPWARKELERALELDIIPLALLEPTIDLRRPISRLEFASVALKAYENLSKTTVPPVEHNPFTDTEEMDALKTLDVGIMVGFSQTIFSPHTELTREQAATVLTRMYKCATMEGWSFETDADYPLVYTPAEPFADDADISNWAKDSVYFMAASGIIQGVGHNVFAPRAVTSVQQAAGYALATREQAVLLALRMVEKEWV